tara:strand:+ start:497 stop:763 length:267 start_codon:yes stop_codon:yes gene_type:complete
MAEKKSGFRFPWSSPSSGEFSYTTLWLNLACAIVVIRFLVGEGLSIGALDWQPGEMDAALPGAILAALGAIYYGRRNTESNGNGEATS